MYVYDRSEDRATDRRRARMTMLFLTPLVTGIAGLLIEVDRTVWDGTLTDPVINTYDHAKHEVEVDLHGFGEWIITHTPGV